MSRRVEQRNPATGELLEVCVNQDVSEVEKAVKKAHEVQPAWAALSFKERAKHVRKIRRFLADNAERGAKIISQSSGKLLQDALGTEIVAAIAGCTWYMNETQNALKPEKIKNGSMMFANKTNTLVYEPVGVVGIISPWNYPFAIPFGEIIMGIMAGNAVVLKVASNSTRVGNFIDECMKAGELPDGLFSHLIVSGAEAGPAMLNARVNKLFFTGSVRVGKQLMAEAAATLTPVTLELGGNDPMLVLPDAAIERAVNCACWAGFQNAGQSCGGVERVYVHRSVYDAFLAQLIVKTNALRHGPEQGAFNVDIGSITTKGQYDTIMAQVDEAVAKGAKIVAQSKPVGDCSKGLFIPATVMTGCTPDMRIISEETFGPILPVIPYDDEEEAIRMCNNCSLALTSSVFSRNAKHAWAVAQRLESGVVTVNDHLYSHGMTESPWGGWKESGIGRTHGYLGLKEMCNVKCINVETLPTSIAHRCMQWYPFSRETYDTFLAVVGFIAPHSFWERVKSAFKVMGKGSFMFRRWVVQTAAHDEARKKE